MPEPPSGKRVSFGEVVQLVRDRVDPDVAGIARYVAGEHMETDDLEIRRWGLVSDGYLGPAFHMRFKPGHVLYGSRRTYLRKVAIAEFEGVCANTTFVLTPRDPSVLLPEFLPYIMQTDEFHSFSITRSKGSVNPYINFSDLAEYEFELPQTKDQEQLLKHLRDLRRLERAYRSVTQSARGLVTALAWELFYQEAYVDLIRTGEGPSIPGWNAVRIGEVCARVTYGFTNPMPTVDEGPWMITATDIADGRINYETARHTTRKAFDTELTAKSRVEVGDVLLTKDGALGRVAVVDRGDVCINQSVAVLRPSDVEPQFLAWSLRAPGVQWRLLKDAGGSAVKHLYISKVADMPLLLPSVKTQKCVVRRIEEADSAALLARDRLGRVRALTRAFVAERLRAGR